MDSKVICQAAYRVNLDVITQVKVEKCVCPCELKCRKHAQTNTRHTQSPPRLVQQLTPRRGLVTRLGNYLVIRKVDHLSDFYANSSTAVPTELQCVCECQKGKGVSVKLMSVHLL